VGGDHLYDRAELATVLEKVKADLEADAGSIT
jgi:hypothetical protein